MARNRRWRRYRGVIAVVVLVAIAGTVYTVTRKPKASTAGTQYVTGTASTGTLSVTVSGTGNLQVRDEVEAYPGTSGTVSKVKVSEGDTVDKGDVLMVLDDDTATSNKSQALASLRQAQEGVAKAKLSVAQAEDALDTLEEKAADPKLTVKDSEIDNAKSQISIAKMGLTSANATLASARADYNDALDAFDELEITAPCDGVVWSVNAAAGDSVSPKSGSASSSSSASAASSAGSSGSSMGGSASSSGTGSSSSSSSSSAPVTIARDGEFAMQMTVNETDVSSLKKGQSAQLTFDAIPDLTISGKVDEVSNKGTVSSGVVSYDVWVTLDVTDKRLKTGMSSTAVIVTDVVRDALLVPNAAVKSDDTNGDYVMVLAAGSTSPKSVPVTVGLANATQTVIKSGLKDGDKVVTQTVDSSKSSSGSGGAGGGFMMGGGPMGGRD